MKFVGLAVEGQTKVELTILAKNHMKGRMEVRSGCPFKIKQRPRQPVSVL